MRPGESGAGCSTAGPGRHVPRRRCVKRRSTRRKLGGKQRKVSPPSVRGPRAPAAAAQRRNYAIRTRRRLSPPAKSSGNHAGEVAGRDSHRLASLTHWEEESAARRPRKPRLPPSGRPSALASPHTHAGGDGQDATAISARGEGRSSSASPTEGSGPRRNSSSRLPPPLSSPFSSGTDG